ncbi:hypothetical protein B296_00024493 [Ensete ventricosum]|uniref:Uncharacterized protein n=1 Tax=Ensete ventricosum TaxID=4639 RepID=A0A426ZSR1_ENSVE|nr:hypothetical protein B296_00024493 [Ensete ventricosum]
MEAHPIYFDYDITRQSSGAKPNGRHRHKDRMFLLGYRVKEDCKENSPSLALGTELLACRHRCFLVQNQILTPRPHRTNSGIPLRTKIIWLPVCSKKPPHQLRISSGPNACYPEQHLFPSLVPFRHCPRARLVQQRRERDDGL